jgi:hypothetical protein
LIQGNAHKGSVLKSQYQSPEERKKILLGLIDSMVTLGANILPEDENKTWAELEHAIQDAIIKHQFGESKAQTTPITS